MKAINKILKMSLILISIFINEMAIGQSTSSGPASSNTPSGATDYIGWQGGTNRILVLKNYDDKQIEFYTNGGYRAKIGNSSEFSLIVGDGSTTLYNNIDIQVVGNTPATEGYRYGGNLILCAPGADNLLCGLNAGSDVAVVKIL